MKRTEYICDSCGFIMGDGSRPASKFLSAIFGGVAVESYHERHYCLPCTSKIAEKIAEAISEINTDKMNKIKEQKDHD